MYILIFLGSRRQSTPPKPARVGERVALACQQFLKQTYANIDVTIIDPLDHPAQDIFKPHFAYSAPQRPAHLSKLAEQIERADAYVMVSPEYNHSMSPALADLLNHFGASLYAYKPSAIVTYSAGQWGGTRAAVNMRTFLSELGCLPVSAMLHIPHAPDVIDSNGHIAAPNEASWQSYFARTFNQLLWWAEACLKQREQVNPHQLIKNFKTAPSERNAPKK
ncbi:NADPH-dependent FMN reductase [Gayadomonas joobiniege]|uniref:NADPH-dependent FMN reductase n=1 Tax=Gayadomonas joobiniege TaxID=1234606 RepID=UPI000378D847|nr:NAD(P)H-dependent oxidoreductase [Gayadomonas joobiniege]